MTIASRFGWALAFALFAATGSASATNNEDEEPELFTDYIHSDLPLWGAASENLWPEHFFNDDGSFGCSSRVALGDWKLDRGEDDAEWWRLRNFGAFHCALIETRANAREDLSNGRYRYSFIIKIGETKIEKRVLELWVLQSGTLPGSEYTLLLREPAEGAVTSFRLLQRKCPSGRMRTGPSMDTWRTTYCAINSKTELTSLAKHMARLSPLGTLDWTAPEPATELDSEK